MSDTSLPSTPPLQPPAVAQSQSVSAADVTQVAQRQLATGVILEPREPAISPLVSIPTLYRLLVRGQLTRFRLFVMFALSAVGVFLAYLTRNSFDPLGGFLESFVEFNIGIVVPLLALMMATPMVGNLIEDRLMAYLVVKPVPRWHISLAALLASFSVLVLITTISVLAAVVASGHMEFIGVATLATALATLAYCAMFMLMGVVTKSGQWIGLVYLFMWETTIARISDGTARLSIRSYVTSIIGWVTDRELPLDGRSASASVVVPIAVAVLATVLAAWVLSSKDID